MTLAVGEGRDLGNLVTDVVTLEGGNGAEFIVERTGLYVALPTGNQFSHLPN